MLARVRIEVPKRMNKKQRELLEELEGKTDLMTTTDGDRPRYMISVAAELVGMHPQTLRIYEQKGLVHPQRTAGNTRLYSDADVERLQLIQRLTTELGLNLAGVERVLHMEDELLRMHRRLERMEQRDAQGARRGAPASTGATSSSTGRRSHRVRRRRRGRPRWISRS